jgi:hypothetical protein
LPQDEQPRVVKSAYSELLGSNQIDEIDSVANLQAPPVLTREMLHARLLESGASPKQIERFLNPRNGRLRPPFDITNRYVFELLRGVYSTIHNEPKIDEVERWMKGQGPAAVRLREEIRHKLQNSGLAQALPGGFDLLPDFYAALPDWARPWYWLLRPRNYYQLGKHIAKHLQWYVEPTTTVKLNPFLDTFSWWHLILAAAFVILTRWQEFGDARWIPWFLIGLIVFMVLTYRIKSNYVPETIQSEDVQRIELYQYLCAEFSEAVDHTPA